MLTGRCELSTHRPPTAIWDVRNKRCSREPSCDLWDDEMLLEERERAREREQAARQPPRAHLGRAVAMPPAPAPYVPLPVYVPPLRVADDEELSWITDPGAS